MQPQGSFRGSPLPPARGPFFGIVTATIVMLLGGCATAPKLPPSESAIVAPVEAMIVPPPGSAGIVKVVSTTFPNAIRQEIHLATQARTAGENKITVVQFVGEGGDGSDARLRDVPFSEVNLTGEALAAWPNTGMAVSPYYVQNDYGPFGYAIGRPPNGDACIYAWQRIEEDRKPGGGVARGAITVRLQLCKRASNEQELLEVMYRLRIKSNVHTPLAAPAAIGRIAAPIRPIGADGFADVIDMGDPAPVSRPPARPQATPAAPVVVPVVVTPAPGSPIVPSPTGGSGAATGPTVPRPPGSNVSVPAPPQGR